MGIEIIFCYYNVGQMGKATKSILVIVMITSLATMGFASNQAFAGIAAIGPFLPIDPASKADPFLGDFMCYDIADIDFDLEGVILQDQFLTETYDLNDIIKICVMTTKIEVDGQDANSPIPQIKDDTQIEQHFVVYRLCNESSTGNNGLSCVTPALVDVPVSIMDQFGTTNHDTPHLPVELWVPASKGDLSKNGVIPFAQAHNIHFKCYDIEPQSIGTTTLDIMNDNFGFKMDNIDTATKLCNPVIKDPPGPDNTPPSQSLDIEHLKCYPWPDIEDLTDQLVEIQDQFFFDQVTVLEEVEFCAAADKFPIRFVAGTLIPMDTTMVLLAGAQITSAWLIPVIVAGIGIAIVIARKF